MKIKIRKSLTLLFFVFISWGLKAQTVNSNDSIIRKKVSNIIPRIGIGMSRHFLTEVGIAYMRSNFIDHKDLGLNTVNFIYYFSFETMTPYKKPLVKGYKVGVEMINIGHVTSAVGIETGYYQKDTTFSFAVTPRIGLPLVNGMLAYGIGLYFNPEMKKEIGRHRITLTYCFNRKSDKALHSMMDKHIKKKDEYPSKISLVDYSRFNYLLICI